MSIPIPIRLVFNARDGRLSISVTLMHVDRVRIPGIADGAKVLDCWAPARRGLVQFDREPEREMSGSECAAALALLDRIAELARGLFGVDQPETGD